MAGAGGAGPRGGRGGGPRGRVPGSPGSQARRVESDHHRITVPLSHVPAPCGGATLSGRDGGPLAKGRLMGEAAVKARTRVSGVHKHVQVREYVRSLVGGAEPGTPAPSERELVQLF